MKKPNASCTNCGRAMWSDYKGQVKPCCHPCRRQLTRQQKIALGVIRPELVRVCLYCERSFTPTNRTVRCCSGVCAQRYIASQKPRTARSVSAKGRRADRERVAPGVRYVDRRNLLSKWKRQGKVCTFCTSLATTIDHAIPLARGGTNYEGNLIPCCKACNSSKSDLLTSEWRYGRPHGGTVSLSPWLDDVLVRQPTIKAEPKPKPERCCYICGDTFLAHGDNRRTCGGSCSIEYAKRASREVYRARVGLSPTWHVPTRTQARAT